MNVEQLRETASHLQILLITLHAHSVEMSQDLIPQGIALENFLNMGWGPKLGRMANVVANEGDPESRHWHVVFGTSARVVEGKAPTGPDANDFPPENVRAIINADFLVQYAIEDGWNPDDLSARLQHFTEHNVTVHVWPFWREWLLNTAQRMGFPPLVLGMSLPKRPAA